MKNWEYIILIIVAAATHIIRSVYEILRLKKKLKPNKFITGIIIVDMISLWISWFALCSLDVNRVNIPEIIKYIGLLLFISGIILVVFSLFAFRSSGDNVGSLITKGIYSKIRHPMYLGFILWLIGYPLYFGELILLLLSVLFAANVLLWRYLEELELEKRFPDYKEYKAKTLF